MRITQLFFGPAIVLSLSALILQPAVSSSNIPVSASMGDMTYQLIKMTVRGTRSDACCEQVALTTGEENNAPRRGFVRSSTETAISFSSDELIYNWTDRRGTRDYDLG